MLETLVLLWLGEPATRAEHAPQLERWANARGLATAPPAPAPGPTYAPALAAEVERLLEEARPPSGRAGAASTLGRARALLEAHPELPQAAWLLAESYALEAHAAVAAPDAPPPAIESSGALLELARALEGPRAASAAARPVAASGQVGLPRLELSGARPRDRVFVDGVPVEAGAARAIAPGRHHVQLSRAEHAVWAGWVDVDAGGELALSDPTRACSALDLADVLVAAEGPRPAPGVACPRWLAARPSRAGGLELARCSGSRCGDWERVPGAASLALAATPAAVESAPPWPAWVTWGLVGLGTVAATGVVLWQAGAFDRDARAETEYVFTGPSAAAAYRF